MDMSVCSSEDEQTTEKKTHTNISRFVELLKNKRILFNKSQSPKINIGKEQVLAVLQIEYTKLFNKKRTPTQLRKKIQNLKTDVRRKADKKAAGKKNVKFKQWELELLDLMNCKPSDTVECNEITMDSPICEIKQEESLDISDTHQELQKEPVSDTAQISNFETEETKMLSTPELQRLVLLEQLKLIRLQIAKEISAML